MSLKPKPGFEVKKSLKKFWEGLGYTLVIAILAAVIKYLSGLEGLTPEQIIWVGLIIAILSASKNAIEHWNDEE